MKPSELSRREYWSEQMDRAYGFMSRILEYPVRENLEPMASLPEAADAAGVEVRFSTSPIAPGFDRVFSLREGLIPGFIAAARELNERDWVMKVEDGYRSTAMQAALLRSERIFDIVLERTQWECGGTLPPADLLLRRVTGLCAAWPKVGTHISGSAVDISVLHRDSETEVDRGAPYIELSELTPMESPFVGAEALFNRQQIKFILERHGFIAYPYEFWHYSQGDAYDDYLKHTGRPARYGPVHLGKNGTVTPVDCPETPLLSQADVEASIEAALGRLGTALP